MGFEFTNYIGEIITAVVTAVVAWFSRGKMQKAETQNSEANAMQAMQVAYDRYVEHNNAVNAHLTERMKSLEDEMHKRDAFWEKKYSTLENELHRVEKYWKDKYETLKKAFESYKREHPKK